MSRQMKDSGIEWIGQIPVEWETDRLQWHLEEINVSNNPVQTDKILSLTIEAGVIPYEDKGNQGNKAKENYEEYKLAYPDTLVVNSMNVIIGAVGISKYFGCVSPVYYVFKATKDTDLRYIYFLFTNVGFQKEMRKYAKGILEIRLRISASDMLKLRIPKLSLEEQIRIADYLDSQCAHIDTVIEKTKASIEEYKKLKQAVITQAVTKGVRGDRPMKDSGIEYLGDVPKEWNIAGIGKLFEFIGGYAFQSERFCDETPYQVLRIGNVKNDKLLLEEKCVFIDDEYADEAEKALLKVNDILFSMTGTKGKQDYFYTVLIKDADIQKRNLYLNQRVGCFRKKDIDINMEYYCHLLKVQRIKDFIFLFETGTANQGNLGIETIKRTKLQVPSIDEQNEIVRYLREKIKCIDVLIAKKEETLLEMDAYKKSLIYEYVTGKKEVPVS